MRVLRAWAAVSMCSAIAIAAAQAPSAKPATAKPAQPAAAAATTTEDGSPIPASPFPSGPPSKAGEQLTAIHKADMAWRETQRGYRPPGARQRIQPSVLPAVDAATQQKALEHYEGVKAQLDKLSTDGMSEAERMNLEIYVYQINTQIADKKFKEYEKPVNSLETFWTEAQGTGQRGFRTEKDYENYLLWMADIPRYFQENIVNMRAGVARGFAPPKITLNGRDQTIVPIANATSADATPFWKAFTHMPSTVNTAEQARLRAEGKKVIEQQVIPAYKELLAFWNTEYYPHTQTSIAAESLPDGKAYYKAQIKRYTTLDLTAEEIHNIGLAEVAKIHQEMLDTIAEAKFQGDFSAFLKFLRTDPQFYAKTPDELLGKASYMMKEFDDKSDRYFGYQPRGRFGIHPIPDEVAPYQPAGFGGAGGFQINLYDLPSRPIYAMPALTLHEAAPGHSWAGLIAREHQNPDGFRGGGSAFGEGWALYCERLGTEMDMYHTPYEKFGMLSFQSWRASRLVVDTGMHSMGWTREQAQQFLRENTALSEHDIEEEVDRYISWPGQALSYYLGMTVIQKERQHAQQALGKKFNIRAFHDAILATGGVPLPVLEEYLEAWIKGGGVGPYPEMEK
ncbi:DUF885 domain-containing protein [Terriglobus roseus]|uniref:Uncharacterized conserved protein, DUF885 familyt n=1 Tax=Terriglobus roseus TaxID=392734 RepID=A0A1G7QZI2_9BACT|nr:DUF885 family protein [Terriglobus roseus]SDG03844.1 Uncharacterized conserved protein, DUF885 familyt [Terriglobus roseus]